MTTPRSRYAEVVEIFAAFASSLPVGDALDPATLIGPLVAERQRDRVEGYIAKGLSDGARLVAGAAARRGRHRDAPRASRKGRRGHGARGALAAARRPLYPRVHAPRPDRRERADLRLHPAGEGHGHARHARQNGWHGQGASNAAGGEHVRIMCLDGCDRGNFRCGNTGLLGERTEQDGRSGGHPTVGAHGRGQGPAQPVIIDADGAQAIEHFAADGRLRHQGRREPRPDEPGHHLSSRRSQTRTAWRRRRHR